ncbi:MAG: tRNA(Ile)(2)-agmatinylcytidine synthase [Candidatus Bathyarchaeia archaeon]
MILHIGIDDTDSLEGGCTTYIAALLVETLIKIGVRFIDYPNLVRLNPNVPWKTRGNGAVCLRVEADQSMEGSIVGCVVDVVEENGWFEDVKTEPGIVFHIGDVPEALKLFAEEAVHGLVSLEYARSLIERHCAMALGYKGMRGLIGALAAVGNQLEGDHTYEFLAYRRPENCGKPRRLNFSSILEMDHVMGSETFNNLDPETLRPLIAPHGPDPVLFGVRGESPEAVHRAGMMIKAEEPIERWVIFRTNQGTDAHLGSLSRVSDLRPHTPVVVSGVVSSPPKVIPGGHVIFTLEDGTGRVECAAYEPTGRFREIVRSLIPGDEVRASGGVREGDGITGLTINLEKLEILRLKDEVLLLNPNCPACGGSMESMGRGKGFRCRRCNFKDRELRKRAVRLERSLKPGVYLPPPRAQRHLTKPLQRYGKEKRPPQSIKLHQPWHWP